MDGDEVVIAAGHTVAIDAVLPAIHSHIHVRGKLAAANGAVTELRLAGSIVVYAGGHLWQGDRSEPILPGVTHTVRWVFPMEKGFAGAPSQSAMDIMIDDWGIWVDSGGRWDVHGAPVRRCWMKLAEDARAGRSFVVVDQDATDWPVGSMVWLTSTVLARTYYHRASDGREFSNGHNNDEVYQIAALTLLVDGTTRVDLTSPVLTDHAGTYPTQGELGLLSHNVVFTTERVGVSDYTVPATRRFAHTMRMMGALGNTEYAEFRQMGHFGALSRYALHTHMMAETGTGVRTRGNSVWRSGHRALVTHETHSAEIEDNVVFDTINTGIYLERNAPFRSDSPEGPHDNNFVHNLVGHVREPEPGKGHPACFWLDIIDQNLLGNVAVSADPGHGADNSGRRGTAGYGFSEHANGTGRIHLPVLVHNEAHSSFNHGWWSWNNNIPSGIAVVDFLAWRNGHSGISFGAYAATYKYWRPLLIENGRLGIDAFSIGAHLQDGAIIGGSGSRADIQTGMSIQGYAASPRPDGPIRLIRMEFDGHLTGDIVHEGSTSKCKLPEEYVKVQGLAKGESETCAATYLQSYESAFRSAVPFSWRAANNANSYWWLARSTVTPDMVLMSPDQANNPAVIPSKLIVPSTAFDPASGALVTSLSNLPPTVTWTGLVDSKGRVFDFTLHQNPALPPEIQVDVAVDQNLVAQVAASVSAEASIAAVEFWRDETLVQVVNTTPYIAQIPLATRERKFSYLYARAVDREGGIGYSNVVEVGPELAVAAPQPQPAFRIVDETLLLVGMAQPGQTLTISGDLINVGDADGAARVRGTLLTSVGFSQPVLVARTGPSPFTLDLLIPPDAPVGDAAILLEALDSNGAVHDPAELTIAIELPPELPPALSFVDIVVPSSVQRGQTLLVTVSIRNTGGPGRWQLRATVAGTTRSSALRDIDADGSDGVALGVPIPAGVAAGRYTAVLVLLDHSDLIHSTQTRAVDVVEAPAPRPAKLELVDGSFLADPITAGNTLVLSVVVVNNGGSPTTPTLRAKILNGPEGTGTGAEIGPGADTRVSVTIETSDSGPTGDVPVLLELRDPPGQIHDSGQATVRINPPLPPPEPPLEVRIVELVVHTPTVSAGDRVRLTVLVTNEDNRSGQVDVRVSVRDGPDTVVVVGLEPLEQRKPVEVEISLPLELSPGAAAIRVRIRDVETGAESDDETFPDLLEIVSPPPEGQVPGVAIGLAAGAALLAGMALGGRRTRAGKRRR